MANSNTVWALVAGIALGFTAGREWPRHDRQPAESTVASPPSTAAGSGPLAPGPVTTIPTETEVPAGWLKEGDFGATEAFTGLNSAQRYTALKVLNEMPCDCGCAHGSVALCKKQDPDCPRAPTIIQNTVAAARGGGTYETVLAAAKKRDTPPPAPPEPPRRIEVAPWNPIRGPRNAKVTIVEFSDFECPYCSKAAATMKQVEQAYGKDVRIAYRHQPLPFHSHAREAAEAAMAAHAQGKFWEMHDKLFANQQALDPASIQRYAQEIGLNLQRFKSDLESHKYAEQIDKDSRRGTDVGATGTPTFFVNGQQLGGSRSFDTFRGVIDAERAKADELLKSGVKLDKLYEAAMEKIPATP